MFRQHHLKALAHVGRHGCMRDATKAFHLADEFGWKQRGDRHLLSAERCFLLARHCFKSRLLS